MNTVDSVRVKQSCFECCLHLYDIDAASHGLPRMHAGFKLDFDDVLVSVCSTLPPCLASCRPPPSRPLTPSHPPPPSQRVFIDIEWERSNKRASFVQSGGVAPTLEAAI